MSLILDALKRLEGRRLLRPIAAPSEPAIGPSRVAPQPEASLWQVVVEPTPARPVPATQAELSQACKTTTVTIEPAPIVLGRELAIGPPIGELPGKLLDEVEELRNDVAAVLNDGPVKLSLVGSPKAPRKPRSKAACHLPVANSALESYRLIRDRALASVARSRPAMLLFTSPDEGEVAPLWPLAVACGEREPGNVLFIDASWNSSFARSYPAAVSHLGIEDVLQGRMTWDDVIRPTTARNVSLLAQGKHPARLETSEVSLWDDLRQQFSLVLIAASPAQNEGTLWIAPLCDATYLVVELGATERIAASQARQSLQDCGANLMGCIVLSPKAA